MSSAHSAFSRKKLSWILVLVGAGFVAGPYGAAAGPAGEPGLGARARAVAAEGPTASAAAVQAEADTVALREWLVLGPFPVPLPAFHDQEGKRYGPGELLEANTLDRARLWPAAGDRVDAPAGGSLVWTRTAADAEGRIVLGAGGGAEGVEGGVPDVAYLAAYLEAGRFVKAKLSLRGAHPVRVFLDDRQVAIRKAGGNESETTAELALTPGKHLLLVKAVRDPSSGAAWSLSGVLTHGAGVQAVAAAGGDSGGARKASIGSINGTVPLRATTQPERTVRITDLLDIEAVSGVQLSPDGEYIAVQYRRPEVPAQNQETWVEVLRVSDGRPVRTFRGNNPVSSFAWAPTGRAFSYVTRQGGKATLWVGALDVDSVRPVVREVERMGGYRWMPDGRSVVYSVTEPGPRDDRGVKRMRDLQDRWAGARDVASLYQTFVASGLTRRLTAGGESTSLLDVSPDGQRLLFTRSRFSTQRPYSEWELWELSLATLEPKLLASGSFGGSATYAPDGERVLVLAGPSAFGGIGAAVPEGVIPNEYDTQAYLLDRATGQARSITRDFDPAVLQAVWSPADGSLYLLAQEGARVGLFRWDPRRETFTRIETGVEAAGGLSIARNGRRLALIGSSANRPPRVLTVELAGRGAPVARTLVEPGKSEYARVVHSRVEDWDFTTSKGVRVTGRLHFPPDFDPSKKYPMIVHYYGGTTPVGRSFGGRYPVDMWAGLGYVVYVPEPSGAIGFGQEFSARHVNNWGITVADEIIEGVESVLAAHPFIDRGRVGCIGASYGGFMTMLLVTRTDLFAACVSHAGISSISSYWGQGWWGYSYSAIATAESFPWNRPDIYVEQSPLFHADRINTPLLLLHGSADTNVPPGESEQMYTALKLLGKEVEFIKVDGEDHHILQYPKRTLWMETIVAWFDRYLKGEPEYWEHLYGGK